MGIRKRSCGDKLFITAYHERSVPAAAPVAPPSYRRRDSNILRLRAPGDFRSHGRTREVIDHQVLLAFARTHPSLAPLRFQGDPALRKMMPACPPSRPSRTSPPFLSRVPFLGRHVPDHQRDFRLVQIAGTRAPCSPTDYAYFACAISWFLPLPALFPALRAYMS